MKNRIFSRRLSLLLSILLLFAAAYSPAVPVRAASGGNSLKSLKIDGGITDWVYDAKDDSIYAISTDTGKLLHITADTLTVQSEEYIGDKPADIELYKGKLYIALSGTAAAAVKDIGDEGGKPAFIALDIVPFYIELGNGKLFYTGKYEHNEIYTYDLEEQKSERIRIKDTFYWSFYYPGLSVDEEKGLLYITDYHNNLTSLKIQDYSSTVIKGLKGMENDRNQLDPVIKQGGDLFFGKSRMKANEFIDTGSFGSNVLYVNDTNIFTKHGVYDRNTNAKVADLPVIADLAIGKDNVFFLYNDEADTIYKYDSVSSIPDPQEKTLKLTMDKEGKLLFSWDEMLNSGGYHLYYSYDGYQIAKDEYRPEISGYSPIQTNRFTLEQIKDEWKNRIVFFGVKADEGKDWTKIAPTNIIEVQFIDGVPLAEGLSEESFKNEDGAFDLSTVVRLSEGPNQDGTISSRFSFDEFLFAFFFNLVGKNMESFELDTGKKSRIVSLQIPGQVYKLLREEGKEKKVIVRAENGRYVLPVGAVEISGIMEEPDNTKVHIEISKVTGSSLADMTDALSAGSLQMIGSPVKFELSAHRNGSFIGTRSFGPEYFECWIPLDSEPDRANTVGLYYDSDTKKVQHVPTRFHRDSSGKYWAALKQNGNGTYALVKHSKTFEDIRSSWAREDIELLASKLVVGGVNGTQFVPDKKVTRAEYVALLVRALGIISREAKSSEFTDINTDDWYYSVVQTAHELGLVNGMNNNTFSPERPISREEMAALIVRAMKFIDSKTGETGGNDSMLDSFKDKDSISLWARESVAVAAENGIISGNQNRYFAPADSASRAESAAVIKRMLERLELIEE